MFIPIRTDYRMIGRPWMNYALIAANAAIYLLGYNGDSPGGHLRILSYMLHPDAPQLTQFFSSAFLHATPQHILGNMLFLWVFGNALNDKLGHAAYLAYYLAGAVVAGVGYVLLSGTAPVLGASGAISAVTGGYLVLFPRARVRVLMILYFITWFDVTSLLFLGFYFASDLLMTVLTRWGGAGGGVAYVAHLSGSLFGMAVAFALLAGRLLGRGEMDLLSLLRHSRRRYRYRQMVARGSSPFQHKAQEMRVPPSPGEGRWVETRSVQTAEPDTQAARELALRREIAAACAAHDLPSAAEKYLQLVQIAEDAVLPLQNQLDVANQLMAAEQHPAAADAYERLLRHYPRYEHAGDIHLMLGLLYGRYLHQHERAERSLSAALEALRDGRKAEMARAELEQVRRRRGP